MLIIPMLSGTFASFFLILGMKKDTRTIFSIFLSHASHFFLGRIVKTLVFSGFPVISRVLSTDLMLIVPLCQLFC